MYKKQMLFQRIVCLAMLVASALVFLYSLGIMTDLYDCLYSTMRDPTDPDRTTVDGSRIFYDMQPFNSELTIAALVLIGVSLILFITCTHSRRKYYIGNFISVGLCTISNIGVSIWAMGQISSFRAKFLEINFEQLLEHSQKRNTAYTDSPFWFDIGYVVFAILIVVTILLVANLILKLIVMKEEKRMIGSRKGVEA